MASVAWYKEVECKDQGITKVKCRSPLEKIRNLLLDSMANWRGLTSETQPANYIEVWWEGPDDHSETAWLNRQVEATEGVFNHSN